jgi:hypothetical protein
MHPGTGSMIVAPVPFGQHACTLEDVPHDTHVLFRQSPLWQSLCALHAIPVAHFEQDAPPQSAAVSSASWIPSEQ